MGKTKRARADELEIARISSAALDTFSSHCEKCTHIYVPAALMLLIKPCLLAAFFFSTGSLTFMSAHSSGKKNVTDCNDVCTFANTIFPC